MGLSTALYHARLVKPSNSACSVIFMLLLSSADLFQNYGSQKK